MPRRRQLLAWPVGLALSLNLAPGLAGLARASTQPEGAPPLYPIRKGDLHGLIDRQGKVLLPAEFFKITLGDPLILVRKDNRTAFFDYLGKMRIEPQNAIRGPFRNGLAPSALADAPNKKRWGYVNGENRAVIAAAYDSAEPFSDGLAVVGLLDAWGKLKFGAIERTGKLVLAAEHDKLLNPSGGTVRTEQREQKPRIFDSAGKDITPPQIDFIGVAAEGMVRVWSARAHGFMTVQGVLTIAPRFENANEFSEGLARVRQEGKYGFIDKIGKFAVEPRWSAAESFSDGLALVREVAGGPQMFIDKSGNVALRPQAERVSSFTEGLAVVRNGNKYGYMDKKGGLALEARFDFAAPFHQGLAYVNLGREAAYITPQGAEVWRGPRA